MLTLYYKPLCQYCQKVLQSADELNVTFDLKNVNAGEKNAEELMKLGGKSQVPFLIDSEKGVSMYESDDIIDYIRTVNTKVRAVKVHKAAGASNVCS